MLLTPYLLFNGNCREAMLFYQDCLGGELTFQTVAEVPADYPFPATFGSMIMQATLRKDSFTLRASDLNDNDVLVNGNTVTFMLKCTSKKELNQVKTKLLSGGIMMQDVSLTSNNAWITSLVDKFGHYWTIFCHGDGV